MISQNLCSFSPPLSHSLWSGGSLVSSVVQLSVQRRGSPRGDPASHSSAPNVILLLSHSLSLALPTISEWKTTVRPKGHLHCDDNNKHTLRVCVYILKPTANRAVLNRVIHNSLSPAAALKTLNKHECWSTEASYTTTMSSAITSTNRQ